MRIGDLVTGIYKETRNGVVFMPLKGALGVVINITKEHNVAQVLYDNGIHSYFLSELCVVTEAPDVKVTPTPTFE